MGGFPHYNGFLFTRGWRSAASLHWGSSWISALTFTWAPFPSWVSARAAIAARAPGSPWISTTATWARLLIVLRSPKLLGEGGLRRNYFFLVVFGFMLGPFATKKHYWKWRWSLFCNTTYSRGWGYYQSSSFPQCIFTSKASIALFLSSGLRFLPWKRSSPGRTLLHNQRLQYYIGNSPIPLASNLRW